jgi:glucose-1-phosphate adenylyltransferase
MWWWGDIARSKRRLLIKTTFLPQGLEIGYHPEEDRKRFTVTPRGIVVVPKGYFS